MRNIVLMVTLSLLMLGCTNTKEKQMSLNNSSLPNTGSKYIMTTYTKTTEDKIDIDDAENVSDIKVTKIMNKKKNVSKKKDSAKTNIVISVNEPTEIRNKIKGVDYGKLVTAKYYSKTAGRETNVNILLPAGYSNKEKYPVLYILHGYWGNEYSMLDDASKIPQIVGNLISMGEAKKMILVFPYIYTSKDQPTCTALDLKNSLNYDNFINDLVTDVMPFIEKNYSVATGRKNTAITGFSMGGRESLFIGFSRPDLFGYIGAVCPAPGLTPGVDLNLHPGQLKENELIIKKNKENPCFIMVSAAAKDNVVDNNPEKYHNILNKNKVEHIWHVIPDGDHGSNSIRPHVYNFVKSIFK